MKLIDELKVTGPAHWASYFINGDASSFDYYNTPDNKAGDRDQARADAFAKWACGTDVPGAHGEIVDYSDESFFDWSHACDCVEYTVLIYGED